MNRLIRALMRRYGVKYLLGIALLTLCVFAQNLAPAVLGRTVDALSAPRIDRDQVGGLVLIMAGLGVVIFALRFAWRTLIIGGSRHIERILREALCEKFQQLPVSFYHTRRTGDLMAYAINDIGAVRMAFGPGIAQLLTGVTTAAFALTAMTGQVHARLTFFALLPVPLAIFAILGIGRVVRERFKRVQTQFAVLSGHVNENIMGMRVIKTFVREETQERLYGAESEEMMRLNLRLAKASAAMGPVTQALFGLSFAVSIGYGGLLVRQEAISIGDFAAFNAYLLVVMAPVVGMGRIVNILQRGTASMRRLNEIFAEPGVSAFYLREDDETAPVPVEARGLTFRYPGQAEDALWNVSFSLRPGGSLGVVGPTGAGKSTLLSLLMKFYAAPEGTLFAGGRDITEVPAMALRRKIGYVPQEGFLFAGTLYDNIAFYEPGVGDARVREAAGMAGLTRDLAQMPQGLLTTVGERGAHVSGGQRQRTALARALIRRPQLLLLDDTLSAVDNHTERMVIEALAAYRRTCSAIIVSHKLSAVAHCDEILYLERGRVAERGTHEALLALCGAYAALWEKQRGEEDAPCGG